MSMRRLLHMTTIGVIVAALPARGQVGVGGGAGVVVDPAGVVRSKQVGKVAKPNPKRQPGEPEIGYVSLPRLFAEVKARLAKKETLTDDMRFLGGMVKLKYVFVDPDQKDLVIAGPIEPIIDADKRRPLGERTGRPLLRLEDLVVALRLYGPGSTSRKGGFGCSIDFPDGGLQRMQAAAAKIGSVRRGASTSPFAKLMADAVGQQPIRYFALPGETNAAFVCIEADLLMKKLSLGLLHPTIKGFRSHFSLMKPNEPIYSRWWYVENYAPLLVSEDGRSYEIRGQALQVNTSSSASDNNTPASPSAVQFAKEMTEHLPDLAKVYPAIADLWNLSDLVVLAALVNVDRLHAAADWNVNELLQEEGFPVAKYPPAKYAEPLANAKLNGQTMSIAAGGVTINPGSVLQPNQRQKSDDLVKQRRKISAGSWVLKE